jgi:2-oxoglutarate ferredoxin oxidoreductase subunit alpha
MSAFGDGYRYHVTGLVHDVRGFPTNRPEEVAAFQTRLQQKISENFTDIQWVESTQVEDADQVVIAYGAVARSALHAVRQAREMGLKVGLLKLITLFPFPRAAVEEAARTAKTLLVPEMNWGQISREVKRVNRGRSRVSTLNKFDGTLITPREILKMLTQQ